ncbi:acyl-CoA dehydrogenase family protein [Paraburkholderia azotifigens]|uniref:acyl-CoA dehydrogenase family protein n=1 Tax=Paraburkholderia azotifigens TaxID=2057004 RepID=UPI0031792338
MRAARFAIRRAGGRRAAACEHRAGGRRLWRRARRIAGHRRRNRTRRSDAGDAPDSVAATVKHVVIDNAVATVEMAIELAGNHGIARRNPLERHHRNVLCGRIHAPANALIRSTAGRAVLNTASPEASSL